MNYIEFLREAKEINDLVELNDIDNDGKAEIIDNNKREVEDENIKGK